jgi:hypothetical protein
MKYNIKDNEKFIKYFLDSFLERGFGALSKREVDILVMHLLMQYSDIAEKSNHQLSLEFLLSPTKIKNLRYEAQLRYQSKQYNYKQEFLNLLHKLKIKKENSSIWLMFNVEDALLKQFIEAKVKDKGSFTDSSFNSEIVKIELSDFIDLLEEVINDQEKIKIEEKLKKLNNTDGNWKELLYIFFKGVAEGAGNHTGKILIDTATGGISTVLGLVEQIIQRERDE